MDPLDALVGLERLGIKFGLENIRALCGALGDPQEAYRSVIVAGTNGKGSVAAMVDRALAAAGHRSARYTSPHLIRLEERFAVDGVPVSADVLRDVTARLLALAWRLRASGELATDPTFFEVCTAIAFEVFRRASVEVAVLEVGMGGRFDATNVAAPCAGAITTIDFDHEQFLGRTIPEIASEKAGIIKPGMTVVVGESKPDALDVIRQACRQRGARLVPAGDGVTCEVSLSEGCTRLEVATPIRRYPPLLLALRGRHQVANAVVAIRLLEALPDCGISVPQPAVVAGLTSVRWPGRLDLAVLGDGRQVLFDAAHNPAGVRALSEYLRETYCAPLPVVFGAMRDKDVGAMLALLSPHASPLILTEPPNPRRATAAALADAAAVVAPATPIEIEPKPRAALDRAWSHGPLVVVAGSIFLVGDLMGHLSS